jgi:hypothetical protein
VPRFKITPLDDQLCFALYSTNIALNRTYKPMLDAMGITYPQCLVLNVLGAEDGASVGTIAGALALEPSSVTPLLKRLEQKGLVRRLEPDNAPRHIQETRRYIQDFIRLDDETRTALELYDRMLTLYPDRINPGSLWGAANAAKASRHAEA